MQKLTSAFLIFLVFLLGCQQVVEAPIDVECNLDTDCSIAGCSGQICTTNEKSKEIVTTCEWRAEYACYKITSCSCNEGKCGWLETEEFKECLENPPQEIVQAS